MYPIELRLSIFCQLPAKSRKTNQVLHICSKYLLSNLKETQERFQFLISIMTGRRMVDLNFARSCAGSLKVGLKNLFDFSYLFFAAKWPSVTSGWKYVPRPNICLKWQIDHAVLWRRHSMHCNCKLNNCQFGVYRQPRHVFWLFRVSVLRIINYLSRRSDC